MPRYGGDGGLLKIEELRIPRRKNCATLIDNRKLEYSSGIDGDNPERRIEFRESGGWHSA